jgi:hypothetical protein
MSPKAPAPPPPAPPPPTEVNGIKMMNVVLRPRSEIKPWPQNVKAHEDAAVDELVAVIKEVGFRVAIVVDEHDFVLKGHRGLLAAEKLGLAVVPVDRMEGVPPDLARAWRIRDNKEGERSEWDMGALGLEMKALQDAGVPLSFTGFDEDEVRKILADEPVLIEPVSVPPLPTMTWALIGIPTVRFGEVAQLIEKVTLIPDAFVEVTANNAEERTNG